MNKEFYDQYADEGHKQVPVAKVKSLVLKYLKSPVLDVGCYYGGKTAMISNHFKFVDGCDISPKAIKEARTRHPSVDFYICDFNKKVKLKQKYNSLCVIDVIEHIFDTEHFLKECHRNLNKDGVIVITTPNVIQLLARIRLLYGNETTICGDKSHIRFFKADTLRQALEQNGFEVIHLSGYNLKPVLKQLPLPINLCEGLVIVGKKQGD